MNGSVKFILLLTGTLLLGAAGGILASNSLKFLKDQRATSLFSPLGKQEVAKDLEDYSFERLKGKSFVPASIQLIEPIATESAYTSWVFKFETEEGKVSGQANIPNVLHVPDSSNFPTVIMLRGYVDKEEYQTGAGTKNAAAMFARAGYLTLAPDFLGFGSSDPEPADEMEARLVRPVTVLQLLASLSNLSQTDPGRVFLWAHSNGGQIALSVLEISSKAIPTTLWAPVSKPFPYSILYYTDELDDHGKYLRQIIARLEQKYDAEKFSITNYFDWITAPIQIHQGTSDDSVPLKWSQDLVKTLKDKEKDVEFFQYPGADHNMKLASPSGGPGWNTVVARDLAFFKSHLK